MIVLRGRDPKVMGHPSPNHQWDVRILDLFLLTLPWAKGTNISLKVLQRSLLFHNQVGWAKAWVEVEARAHRPGL